MSIARDKFWLFGVRPHQDDMWFGPRWREDGSFSRKYNWSRITPAEGAFMLDIPNLMMVTCDGQPSPFSHEAYGYAESFLRLKNVQWSCTGSEGFRAGNEEAFLCDLAEKYPNISGAYLDDFFGDPSFTNASLAEKEAYARKALDEIAEKLQKAPRPLDLHLVYYPHIQREMDPAAFEKVTMLSMFTWSSKNLVHLEENFGEMERLYPHKKKMIGVYLFDFSGGHPVPLDRMEYQCNFALRMLKEGRADGIIFEANSIMGMGMDSELWLRDWIEAHKSDPIP